jgi:basic membrane protein A
MGTSRRELLKAVAAFAAGAVVGSGATYVALQSIRAAVEKTATSTPVEASRTAVGLPKMKIHFIYVGPIGDYGWTHAHDVGRKYLKSILCPDPEKWCIVETSYTESVPEDLYKAGYVRGRPHGLHNILRLYGRNEAGG